MGEFIKDISPTAPGSGSSVVLRTVDVSEPLSHSQFDQNIWLIAQEALAAYNKQQEPITSSGIADGAIKANHLAEGAVEAVHISQSMSKGVVPSGTIFPFAGIVQGYPTVFNDSFFLCDGSVISRSDYASLYSAIQDTYGAGDGSTTFKLPDLRGRVVIGHQQAGSSPLNPTIVGDPNAQSLGGMGGSDTHTLSVDELPAHQHDYVAAHHFNSRDHGKDNASGFNRYVKKRFTGNINSQYTGMYKPSDVAAAIAIDAEDPKPVARSGDQPHANLQPYMVVNYIIKI